MTRVRNHIIVWILYFAFCWITDSVTEPEMHFIDVLLYILIHPVLLFYSSVFVISRFSIKSVKAAFVSIGWVLLNIGVFLGLKLFYRLYIVKWLNVPPYGHPFHFIRLLSDASTWYLHFNIWGLCYSYALRSKKREADWRKSQEEKYRLEQENLKQEQTRLQAEYAFLRSQINPHFLHNTLNFFYSKSLHCSNELADGILTLSEIMRYSLHVGDDNGNMVPLNKEIEHMQNVIKINQLRFSNRLNIDFAVEGNVDTVSIIPFVLITLVENAFKHGDLADAACPLTLRLSLDSDTGLFRFYTFNRKKTGPKELSHGIGMDNIRKRLQWAYGSHYSLAIKDEAAFYSTELSIRGITRQNTLQAILSEAAVTHKTPSHDQVFDSRR